MKKLLCIISLLLIMLIFAACGGLESVKITEDNVTNGESEYGELEYSESEYSESEYSEPEEDDYSYDVWLVCTKDDDLNIRKSPSISSKKLGAVEKDGYVLITDYSDNWGYTEINTIDGKIIKGWVSLDYCRNLGYSLPPNTGLGDNYVYITRTGECYHTYDCYYVQDAINNGTIKSIAIEAAEENYRACSYCNP